MDAIDILGGLLGGNKGSGGLGGKILKDILTRGQTSAPRSEPPPRSQPPSRPAPAPRGKTASPSPTDLERQARELEDLLGVARDRDASRAAQRPSDYPKPTQPTNWEKPSPRRQPHEYQRDDYEYRKDPDRQNEEAMILIRAMINAAKSDGRVTADEQQAILKHFDGAPRDALQFLQREFDCPLDVREFAWSVPLGMEQKVYTVSLSGIDLDTNQEAVYLKDLAHGLRLPNDVCDQIHRQWRAPLLRW